MRLKNAYTNTVYFIKAPKQIFSIQINRKSREFDQFLEARSISTYALITAYNPQSIRVPPEENDRKQRELIEEIKSNGYTYFLGYNQETEDWPEEKTICALNISKDEAIKLGTLFSQNAIVYGSLYKKPELLWCIKIE